jgi:hypothetical protein
MVTWSKRRLYRLYNRHTGDHLYTIHKGERPEGYVEEGIICRLLAGAEAGRTVPLLRLRRENPPDHILTVSPALHDGYEELGHVYSAERWRTVPVYELDHQDHAGGHFYTSDRGEAVRAVAQGEYDRHRVICHALPPPIDRRLRRWVVTFAFLGVMVALLAARFGDGHNALQRLTSAWVLLAGFASAASYLLGVAVGKRP